MQAIRYRTVIIGLLAITLSRLNAQSIYVSPNGNDQNPGTIDKPYATLNAAKQAVKKLNNGSTAITVYLRKGVYYLTEPFVLGKEDGGTKTAPITYTAYANDQVSLRGSRVIDLKDIKPIADKTTLKRIPGRLRDSIVMIDLDALKIANIKKYDNLFNDDGGIIELFMDEKRMPLSRYPNEGSMTIKKVIINGGGQETKTGDWANYYGEKPPPTPPPRPGVFEYRDNHENAWAAALDRGVWIKGFWRIPWQNEAVRIANMDTLAHTITLAAPVPGGIGNKYTRPEGNGKEPYWLMNLLEEIDRPGEWAVDFKDKKLYFYPPKKITAGSLRIADMAEPLVQLNDASYVQLKRLTIEENMNNGVQIKNGTQNLIAGCTVRNITKNGIVMDGGQDHEALSNDVYNIGAAGIWLRGGDETATPKIPANFKVVNNHIYHFSQLTRIYSPGINAGFTGGGGGGHHPAVGMYIAHNLIHDTPHVGVLFGSWNSVFEYNEVYDYCQISDDMGAFYSYDQFDRMGGHTFAYNFIHNSTIGDGIYFDHDHRDIHIYGNIVALYNDPKRRGTAFLYKIGSMGKPGFKQVIDCYNNIAVNCNYGFQFVCPLNVVNNINNNISVLNGVFYRNRLIGDDGKEKDAPSIPGTTGKNMEYKEDPGFVNLKGFDFRLKPDSKVFTDLPAFKPIPFEKIGLFVDEYRKKLPTDKEIKRFEVMPTAGKNGTEILDRN
jgi:hypothetical protein